MIRLVQSHEVSSAEDLIDQMFQLRARTFRDRLGWAVEVTNGRERDRFDDCGALYVLSVEAGRVNGCARLLQTTGPHMLSDVFQELLPQGLTIRSPLVWESTRFCVDFDEASRRSPAGLSLTTGEIMAAEIEVGLAAGLSHIVTVVDVRMERILKRGGCPVDRLAPPRMVGKVMALAVLIEVSASTLASIRSVHAIDGQCVPSQDLEQLAAAA